MENITLFLIMCVCVFPVKNQSADSSLSHNNMLGSALQVCSLDPLTGWTRSGKCEKWAIDQGTHLVCAQVTDVFLKYNMCVIPQT